MAKRNERTALANIRKKTFREKLMEAWVNRPRPLKPYVIHLVNPNRQHETWELLAPDEGFALAEVFYILAEDHYPHETHPLRRILSTAEILRVEQLPEPEVTNWTFANSG